MLLGVALRRLAVASWTRQGLHLALGLQAGCGGTRRWGRSWAEFHHMLVAQLGEGCAQCYCYYYYCCRCCCSWHELP